jgi:Ca2+/Na+ antiporter
MFLFFLILFFLLLIHISSNFLSDCAIILYFTFFCVYLFIYLKKKYREWKLAKCSRPCHYNSFKKWVTHYQVKFINKKSVAVVQYPTWWGFFCSLLFDQFCFEVVYKRSRKKKCKAYLFFVSIEPAKYMEFSDETNNAMAIDSFTALKRKGKVVVPREKRLQ